jgi:hypothetical protein
MKLVCNRVMLWRAASEAPVFDYSSSLPNTCRSPGSWICRQAMQVIVA